MQNSNWRGLCQRIRSLWIRFRSSGFDSHFQLHLSTQLPWETEEGRNWRRWEWGRLTDRLAYKVRESVVGEKQRWMCYSERMRQKEEFYFHVLQISCSTFREIKQINWFNCDISWIVRAAGTFTPMEAVFHSIYVSFSTTNPHSHTQLTLLHPQAKSRH